MPTLENWTDNLPPMLKQKPKPPTKSNGLSHQTIPYCLLFPAKLNKPEKSGLYLSKIDNFSPKKTTFFFCSKSINAPSLPLNPNMQLNSNKPSRKCSSIPQKEIKSFPFNGKAEFFPPQIQTKFFFSSVSNQARRIESNDDKFLIRSSKKKEPQQSIPPNEPKLKSRGRRQ